MSILKIRNAANDGWIEISESQEGGPFLPLAGGTITGDLNISQKQLIGGIGAETTGGDQDWDATSNCRSGSGYTLLNGNDSNGMGGTAYFHAFNFEYAQKDGTGNMTQLAIPYGSSAHVNKGVWMRGRYSGSWSDWIRISPEYGGYKKNLYVNYGSPATTTVKAYADAIEVVNALGGSIITSLDNDSCILSGSGAGGLDTGSEAASTWYYVHAIYNPMTAVSTLMFSLSETSPTMPSGYTHWRCIHEVYNNSSSNIAPYSMRIDDDVYFYRWQQIYYGYLSTSTWTAKALPLGVPYARCTHLYLEMSSNNINVGAWCRMSSYAGDYYESHGEYSGSYNNTTYTLRYRNNSFTLPYRFTRNGNVYVRTGYSDSNYSSQNCDIRGYRLPR